MSKALKITKDFLIEAPVYVLWILLVGACVTSWNAAIQFKELKDAIRLNWSFEMQKDFALGLRLNNPTLVVPDVYQIRAESLSSANYGISDLVSTN